MLDVISGGRVNLGIGSGYQRQEFEGLGIDMEESRERFVEAVEVMTKAWPEFGGVHRSCHRYAHRQKRPPAYKDTRPGPTVKGTGTARMIRATLVYRPYAAPRKWSRSF